MPGTDHDVASTDSVRTASARAGANFALVKYWGKRDTDLNLPDVGSISITLDALYSETTVSFDPSLDRDEVTLDGQSEPAEARRVSAFLDRARALAGSRLRARVDSRNNFATAAGLASSASGFAALTRASADALGLEASPGELSALARTGSGSAARSMFGGFVEMARGRRDDGYDSVARELAGPDHWPLTIAIAITTVKRKAVGSTEGMQRTARTSPFYRAWVDHQESDLALARSAIAARDFEGLADVSEASALAMHGLAMSARPGLLYFNAATIECLHRVRALRGSGTPVFFTVDAGPQVKAIALPQAAEEVAEALADVPGVVEVVRSGLGPGAQRRSPTS